MTGACGPYPIPGCVINRVPPGVPFDHAINLSFLRSIFLFHTHPQYTAHSIFIFNEMKYPLSIERTTQIVKRRVSKLVKFSTNQ